MDIEYLLALQELRHSLGSVAENVMVGFSLIGDGPALVAIALVVYWCIDKRAGQVAMSSLAVGNFASQLIKNLACVYRPWIRDARIIPAEGAIEGAGGYSFPSGHTTGTTTTLGSLAWSARRRSRLLVVVFVLIIAIIAFSRNFLGVHTPQDVVVGFVVALVAIVVSNTFFRWMDRCDAMIPWHNRDIAVMVIVVIMCIASVAIVELKPYPMDIVNGQLLVDPETMKKGSFEAAGLLGGVTIGWVLERRIVRFDTGVEVGVAERVVRGIVGVGIVGVVYVLTDIGFKAVLPYIWAKLCAYTVLTLAATFVVPLTFKLVQRVFRPAPAKRGAHSA